jgi:hypothetical protein
METRSPAPRVLYFSELHVSRQKLIRLCQATNFGSIQHLTIIDGQPTFSPPPVVVVELKLDSDDERRPEVDLDDFLVRSEFQRLLNWLDHFGNGMIEGIDVRAGIPRRLFFQTVGTEVLR